MTSGLKDTLKGHCPASSYRSPALRVSRRQPSRWRRTLHSMGYLRMPGLHVGRSESISFYNQEKRIALFDAHPANFFYREGVSIPVDGIILQINNDSEHDWLSARAVGPKPF